MKKNISERIATLLQERLLDAWSQGFLESVLSQYESGTVLSQRQLQQLTKIESRFSPGEKEKLEKWEAIYKSEHHEIARVIASYYSKTTYFQDLATNILCNADYIPNMHRYRKMSDNKYAQGVWKNWSSDPLFVDGQMVQVRKQHDKRDRLGFVLNSKQPVVTHAKGGKAYQILLFGESSPTLFEERNLKKPDKKGKHI
jgi:hypothetical protein